MRLKRLENQWRVYLNPWDYKTLREHAESRAAEIAIRLGGECSLRVQETADLRRGDWRDSTHPDVDRKFLKIWGKDTTGKREEGKFRSPPLPDDLWCQIAVHIIDEQIYPGEELLPVTKRTVQEYIKRAAIAAAEGTGNEDFEKISSHDLRSYYATDALIRRGMEAEVVMAVGGWASYTNMEPYLNAQFDDVIAAEYDRVGAPGVAEES